MLAWVVNFRLFSHAATMSLPHLFSLLLSLPVPFAAPLFSITYNNQISQPLCFVNDTKCPGGVGPPAAKTLHEKPARNPDDLLESKEMESSMSIAEGRRGEGQKH